MAQHILMKDQIVLDRVNKAIQNGEPECKLWDRQLQERADIDYLKHYDIHISQEDFDNHKVYMVHISEDIKELQDLLQDEPSLLFEVFEFENQRVVWWVI